METQHNSTKSNIPSNVLNPNREDSSKLKDIQPIEGTPFNAIFQDQIGWFGALGNHIVTKNYDSKEELDEYINQKSWDLITNLVNVAVIESEKLKEINEHLRKEEESVKSN